MTFFAMIHIYTGNGKGKTSAAFGLAMRASGQGLKVIIFQFLKPKEIVSGEEISAKKLKGLKVVRFDQAHPIFKNKSEGVNKTIEEDFEKTKKAALSGKYDMVVLDEIINVVDQGFIKKDSFISLLGSVPGKLELILTGRGDTLGIEEYADYVTVMTDKKHPFKKTTDARKGIEY